MRERMLVGLAQQLSRPEGMRGRLVGRLLNRRNASLVSAAVAATGLQPGDTAADIGFGGGAGLDALLRKVSSTGRLIGVELSDTMLKQAERGYRKDRTRGRLLLLPGNITDLPLADASVNGAISANTIYFVEDLDRAFAELWRVLRPSGRVVIGLGDPDAMASMPVTSHGFRLRPVADVVAQLERAGFDVQQDRVGSAESAPHLVIGSRRPAEV